MTTRNLWPEFQLENVLRTPKAILNEQAEFLAKGTKNLLNANIKISASTIKPEEISYSFNIIAPNLGGYSYHLFRIVQNTISMYPCILYNNDYQTYEIMDETDFLEKLAEIFNSPQTQKVITSLISQSIDENIQSV